jgi:hypothetical protein
MNRWTRINLLLAAMAATLLVLHLWPADSPSYSPLTALDAADVSSIRIERRNRLVLSFERNDSGWQLAYPQVAVAQDHRVQQLLAIAYAPVQNEFPANESLAQYGLDAPSAVLQLDQLRLSFGERDPGQRSRYVLVDGRIRVIDDVYFNFLTLPVAHFIGG